MINFKHLIFLYSSFVRWFHVFFFLLVQDRIQPRVIRVSGLPESGPIPQPFFVFLWRWYFLTVSHFTSVWHFLMTSFRVCIPSQSAGKWFRASQGTAWEALNSDLSFWDVTFDSVVKRWFDSPLYCYCFFPCYYQ